LVIGCGDLSFWKNQPIDYTSQHVHQGQFTVRGCPEIQHW